MIENSKGYKTFLVFDYFMVALLALICLLPMIHILAVSLSDRVANTAGMVTFWPVNFNLESYRYNGDVSLHTPCNYFGVKARRDNEFRAAFQRLFALVERDNCASADQHFRAVFADHLDGIRCCSRAERDFHHVHAASKQRPRGRNGIFCVIQNDYWHNTSAPESI